MIYFAQRRIEIESHEETAKFLNQATSKVSTMFDLTSTSTYVIFEERPLIGQKLKSGETLISRFRHMFLRVVPRIVSRWNIENVDGKLNLVVKHRLGIIPTIPLLLSLFSIGLSCIMSCINMKLPDFEAFSYSIVFSMILVVLARFEVRVTDKIISKVIKNEKVKSLVTV